RPAARRSAGRAAMASPGWTPSRPRAPGTRGGGTRRPARAWAAPTTSPSRPPRCPRTRGPARKAPPGATSAASAHLAELALTGWSGDGQRVEARAHFGHELLPRIDLHRAVVRVPLLEVRVVLEGAVLVVPDRVG